MKKPKNLEFEPVHSKNCFQKIQDGGWFFHSNRHLEFFWDTFFTKFASHQHQMNAKRRFKKWWILSELCQKIRFGSAILFRTKNLCLIWQNMFSIHVTDKNTNSLQKPKRKNIIKCRSYAIWISARFFARFILKWNFLNKTSNLNFVIGYFMGNKVKAIFL
jgi:hypothetical protein